MEEFITTSYEKPERLTPRGRETFWFLMPMMMAADTSTEAAQ